MSDNKNNNKNDMNIYDINNNRSSSSISSMEDDVFIHIQALLSQYRIDEETKNDGNDRYYAIMPQDIPDDYGGDVLCLKKKIPEEITQLVNILKGININKYS
jgi:hypothetical protein